MQKEKFQAEFKVGDDVEFGRSYQRKTGVIVAIGDYMDLLNALPRSGHGGIDWTAFKADSLEPAMGANFAVLVRVDRYDVRGRPLKPWYYKPYPAQIEKS